MHMAIVSAASFFPSVQTFGYSELMTTQVSQPECVMKIRRVTERWLNEIRVQYLRVVQNMPSLSKSCVDIVLASKAVIESVMCELSAEQTRRHLVVYAAMDRARKIQGVAIALFRPFQEAQILYLATHPKNLPGDGVSGIRGVGTALVRHIARDVLVREDSPKVLSLISTASAIAFYIRLGFQQVPGSRYRFSLSEMGARNLVGSLMPFHTIVSQEPSLLHFREF